MLWTFYLIETHGIAKFIEPNMLILHVEFASSIFGMIFIPILIYNADRLVYPWKKKVKQ